MVSDNKKIAIKFPRNEGVASRAVAQNIQREQCKQTPGGQQRVEAIAHAPDSIAPLDSARKGGMWRFRGHSYFCDSASDLA
jgi:hypothetical protein